MSLFLRRKLAVVLYCLIQIVITDAFTAIPYNHKAASLGVVRNNERCTIQSRNLYGGLEKTNTISKVTTTTSSLYSLNRLIDDVESSKSASTIFVGGKGGVGKTTVSSALAVHLASDKDLRVLIVSTDPAHSLGDCIDEQLSGRPIQMTDPVTHGNLFAQEVDAEAALMNFRENLAAFDVNRLAEALQVPPDLLNNLGLSEFSGLLNNPPPGLDELVALSNVFDGNDEKYDVVVVDTAPTGHTLRLLALPQFLDGFLGKLIQLRMKLSGIANTLQAFLGNDNANQRAAAIDNAVQKLEQFRTKMSRLRSLLQNQDSTRFVVVTIPTVLGIAESKRLVKDLSSQSVSVTDIVVNQCVIDDDDLDSTALDAYYQRRIAGQHKWIDKLKEIVADVSSTDEYRKNNNDGEVVVTEVPFFDVELVGPAALGYVGSQVYTNNAAFSHLLNNDNSSQKVVICGGKGGVGKTTTSASLAVTMAAAGHKVALISTDPAHSLGDAVGMNLAGGSLQDCPLLGVPNNTGDGSLSVLEIDPATSLRQFKGVVDQLMGEEGSTDMDNSKSGLRDTLKDLQEVFDTLPAGTDEVVALAKIINLVKKGDYDRIVLDTAPTGHTLRMLSTPGFLADLIERLLNISDKINSNAAVQMFMGTRREQISVAVESAKSKLLSFQFQMYDLEDLFTDSKQTEFLIVTVPTELAVRESSRLLNDLTFDEMPIRVRNVVVNQVLRDEDASIFLSHVAKSQSSSISDLEQYCRTLPESTVPQITKVPYLDTEPRGVFGLKILGSELLKEIEPASAS